MSATALPRPLQAPAPHTAALTDAVRVRGQLLHDAEVRVSTGAQPRAMLVLQIAQPFGLTYEACKDYGPAPTAYIAARSKANALRHGCTVEVHASGIVTRKVLGTDVLKLVGVTDVFHWLRNPIEPQEAAA